MRSACRDVPRGESSFDLHNKVSLRRLDRHTGTIWMREDAYNRTGAGRALLLRPNERVSWKHKRMGLVPPIFVFHASSPRQISTC